LLFSFQELKDVLLNVPEIVELVGSAHANRILHLDEQDEEEKAKSVLRSTFTQLMLASKETITEAVSKIKSRLHTESQVSWKFYSLLIFHCFWLYK
jgi:mannose-6-phosphate isomerase